MKSPKSASGIVLQPRDLSLVRMLAEQFRILNRDQIAQLLSMGSVSRLNYRLKQLRDAGYLSCRSLLRLGNAKVNGYYLGPRAAELFDDPTERRAVEKLRNQASLLSPVGLMHRSLVDSIHIRFLTANRDYPSYKLMTWIDQYSPWWESVRRYGVPVQADAYAEYLMLTYFDSLFTFFLEVDSGTERGKFVRDKVSRYVRFAESGVFEQRFAASGFRVLFVTNSERRARGLGALIASYPSNIFWLTSWERLKHAKLLDRYWTRPGLDGLYSLTERS